MADKELKEVEVSKTLHTDDNKVYFAGIAHADDVAAKKLATAAKEQTGRIKAQGDDEPAGSKKGGDDDISDDFPHAATLRAAGVTSMDQLRGYSASELLDLEGIGQKRADEITEALDEE